jgi:hypothetical protein
MIVKVSSRSCQTSAEVVAGGGTTYPKVASSHLQRVYPTVTTSSVTDFKKIKELRIIR